VSISVTDGRSPRSTAVFDPQGRVPIAMRYITAYKPDWPARFERIISMLRPHLPAGCRFHHVGSTSIGGMPSKDIIDIDIECPVGSMFGVIKALAVIGYVHEGDKGILTREAFSPVPGSAGAEMPAHHLYACEASSPELRKHLAFREYLRAHSERAQWLAEQKQEADNAATTPDEYIMNKNAAYEVITHEALGWADSSVE
jgi:GrpB-like predicted nucleotidyltransferase (UPF0157 family)